ncbi:hypothetical protein B0H67DRAFT_685345 [Lasiosphaeris hirsuta]|uniref:Uncharacterized protein n=1 Tax=Lasiosphaeris hirsuta TaxID=260670 RepID=A0AA40DSH2_9PEZI|nr:hypothetical protein B0H67DRAFT_685345 [Lasiosphaeris hirsuta]
MAGPLPGPTVSMPGNHDAPPRRELDPNVAGDLTAIRALLQAIAQHNLIEIPKEASSLAISRSTGVVDPSGSHYDEAETIDYHVRQLSNWGLTLHSSTGGDNNLSSEPGTAARIFQSKQLGQGISSSLLWMSDTLRHDRHVDYDEFGYDGNGYPCSLGHRDAVPMQDTPRPGSTSYAPQRHEIKEHIFKKADGQILNPPWAGQHFGKEWNIGLHGAGDEEVSSLVTSQLSCRADETAPNTGHHHHHHLVSPRPELAICFLNQFEGKWGLNWHSWSSSEEWGGGSMAPTMSHKEDALFQYHMRVFTTQSGRRACQGRVSGNLTVPSDAKRNLDIHEIRYSVGLKTTWKFDLPVFTLVTMTNSFSGLEDLGELHDANIWKAVNIRPSIRATGVAAFAFRVRSLLPGWADQWTRLLDQIDRVLSADLANILSPESRREIMVDGSDLRLSEFYPAVLQILRIAADWIQESMDDLRWMVDDTQRLYFSPNTHADSFPTFLPPMLDAKDQDAAIAVFRQNWESVQSYQQRLGKSLLIRIARKQEEVKNLKDGMFNATSVNEAKKSTKLNHYILVFTVVTIFYLPLSFIATLFALGLSTWEDPRQFRSFTATITLVAAGTYAFSGFLIWFTQRSTIKLNADLRAPMKWFQRRASVPKNGLHAR